MNFLRKLNPSLLGTCLVVLLWSPLVAAQTSKGAIAGNATDPDGAVVPGATVTVTNTATNASRQTTTDADGNYRVEVLDPGTYRVTLSLKGFKTTAVDNVLVRAAQITSVDVKLEAGQLEETIEVVETTGADLQKESGDRTNTISAREVVELPISTLNVIQLTLTLPGVAAPSGREDFTNGIGLTVNGNRPRGNNFLLDGQDNNDTSITGQAYFPTNREAIQEVTLLGGDNSAEYGRAGTAVVNVITQGGTNEYHGAASWLLQSQLFNALSPDEQRSGLTEPDVFTENTAAFKFGGPIFKNKLLGFGSAQWDRFRSTDNSAGTVRVPTEAGVATLRSVFPAGSNRNVDLFLNAIGPLRGRTNLSLVPLGRAANGQNRPNVEFGLTSREGLSTIADDTQFVTRVDWLQNANNTATFRYLFDDSFFFPALVGLPGEDIFVPARNHNMAIFYTHASDRLVNEFRFSYVRQRVPFDVVDPSILTRPFISIGTLIGLGVDATFPQDRLANNWQWQDTLRIIMGNHTVSLGGDFNRQLPRITNLLNDRGTVNFANGGGYVAFGNFVDNFSGPRATITRDFGERVVYPKTFFQNYFVSDSWKVRPNVTLVLGLRYENYGTPENILRFPAHTGDPFQDFQQVIKQEPDNNNFAPRFSFAYTPQFWQRFFGEDKTVFRGGWGVGYEAFFYNILINTGSGNPNIISFNRQAGSGRGFMDPVGILLSTPTPTERDPSGAIISVGKFLKNPQIHNWNFGLQRELPWNTLFDLAYVGTRGIRLFVNDEKNPGIAGGDRINPIHTNIILRTNSGDSIYHSLQLKVERQFSASAAGNLFLRGSYTWSRYVDNGSEVFVTTGDSSFPQDTFNRDLDRGLTAYHRRHRFVLTYVWEIPGPPRSDNRGLNALGYVLRDWQLSGITTFQSGAPFTIVNGTIDSNGDARPFNDRVSLGNPNAPRNSYAVSGLVAGGDPNLFYDGPTFSTRSELVPVNPSSVRWLVIGQGLGNVGRNTEIGRPFNQTDFTIGRSFRIPRLEGHSLEFRWEAFNVFNHPNTSIGLLSFNPLDGPEQFLNFDLTKTGFRFSRFYLRYSF